MSESKGDNGYEGCLLVFAVMMVLWIASVMNARVECRLLRLEARTAADSLTLRDTSIAYYLIGKKRCVPRGERTP